MRGGRTFVRAATRESVSLDRALNLDGRSGMLALDKMVTFRLCDVCGEVIYVEASGNKPGSHDPAYHVAQAYHYPKQDGYCASCGQRYPCLTVEEYSI